MGKWDCVANLLEPQSAQETIYRKVVSAKRVQRSGRMWRLFGLWVSHSWVLPRRPFPVDGCDHNFLQSSGFCPLIRGSNPLMVGTWGHKCRYQNMVLFVVFFIGSQAFGATPGIRRLLDLRTYTQPSMCLTLVWGPCVVCACIFLFGQCLGCEPVNPSVRKSFKLPSGSLRLSATLL